MRCGFGARALSGRLCFQLGGWRQIHSQPIRMRQRVWMSLEGNGDRASFTCLSTSAGILHGLHSDEALAALRPGQQSLLLPAAAWRRTLPTKPAIQLTAPAQIPNDHAGEEPNGHGRHAVYSAAGTSTHARAPCLKHGCMVARVTCSVP